MENFLISWKAKKEFSKSVKDIYLLPLFLNVTYVPVYIWTISAIEKDQSEQQKVSFQRDADIHLIIKSTEKQRNIHLTFSPLWSRGQAFFSMNTSSLSSRSC